MKKKVFIVIACLLILLIGAILIPKLIGTKPDEQELSEEQIASINAALDDESKDRPIEEQFRITVAENDLSVVKGLDEDWLNILLMGTDTRGSELNNGRTDAMLVLSLHTGTGQMKLTSLIRDMLVTIPGYKTQNRINSANAFGGPLLAMKTVNELLGLNIERYCSVNFPGFMDVVNLLGGVTLTLSAGEVRIVGAQTIDKPQLLNGYQALTYVRIREIGSNFARNERQRKFLTAMLAQIKTKTTDEIITAISAAFNTIATNLTTGEVIALLPTIIDNTDTMDLLSLPQEDTYKFARTKAGASVIEFKEEEAKSAFHAFVYDSGQFYPHHNLYFIISREWDLKALQTVLRSGIAKLFVSLYSTQMRGGYLRFQAQYLRRIRIPRWKDIPPDIQHKLITSHDTDIETNNQTVFDLYQLTREERAAIGGNGNGKHHEH